LSIRKNPTREFSLAVPFDDAFTSCRDRLGEKTNREFDFVDRRSGYIQGRVENHNLVRIMCYEISEQRTGVIISCYDLMGGALGSDLWTLKNLLAEINGESQPAEQKRKGPILLSGPARKTLWFLMTAIFACVSAMLAKVAIYGDHHFWPMLAITSMLTAFGFY